MVELFFLYSVQWIIHIVESSVRNQNNRTLYLLYINGKLYLLSVSMIWLPKRNTIASLRACTDSVCFAHFVSLYIHFISAKNDDLGSTVDINVLQKSGSEGQHFLRLIIFNNLHGLEQQ